MWPISDRGAREAPTSARSYLVFTGAAYSPSMNGRTPWGLRHAQEFAMILSVSAVIRACRYQYFLTFTIITLLAGLSVTEYLTGSLQI